MLNMQNLSKETDQTINYALYELMFEFYKRSCRKGRGYDLEEMADIAKGYCKSYYTRKRT